MGFYLNKFSFIVLILCAFQLQAQDKWIDRNAQISFDAKVPSFEPVAAKTESATAVFEPQTAKIAALVFVNTFKFKVALMQEHFNESYAESSKYPKATFEGEVLSFDDQNINGTYKIKGNLTIKNTTKSVEILAQFKQKQNSILLTSEFEVDPEDYGFDIPKVVRYKIAKKVTINLSFVFKS
ncbi:YceI family protein [Mesohalobacter salilacus]|uniref:YceI family protein n=1 Tax=Mesohalobacter salilacus TaxID=2491711 RepID=UPI00269E66EF